MPVFRSRRKQRLYHVTSAVAAEAILTGGFVDDHRGPAGIWLSDRPIVDATDTGAVLAVDIRRDVVTSCEMSVHDVEQQQSDGSWLVLPDEQFRAWQVPAALLNRYGRIHRLPDARVLGRLTRAASGT